MTHHPTHPPRTQPRTVGDVLARAIDERDGVTAGRVIDFLRSRHGFTYDQGLAMAQRLRPHVTPADWDALMYEADTSEVYG